jgi:outer membrane cobalamin receptor
MLKFRVFSILFLIISTGCALFAQNNRKTYSLSGTVLEASKNTAIALPYATVAIPEYSQATTTNSNGKFALKNIPSGKFRLTVSFVGKVTIDTIISLSNNLNLNFKMQENNFRLKQVVITVEQSKTGQSTASSISRTAMEHLQATSLKDIMSLLPGGLSQNQNLNTASQFTIRSISSNTTNNNFNALGTAIVQDGAPLSNNANLQSMNPVVTGAVASLGGDASPAGGVDIRSISVENIESVEVIRGIPSVEYGDLTSGVVILNTKAGKEPVRIKGKSNINVYQLSASGGFDLGKNKGALNVGGDFAYNVNDPVQSYLHYQRATASVKYSNTFWGNLRSNTTFDFIYGKNSRDKNPDNLVTQTSSEGTTIGNKLNTNGIISINKGLLKTIKYVASVSYTEKKSFYEQLYTSANAPYSATLTDGAILSNKPNTDIYDKDGNKITNIGEDDKNNVATYLPDSYLARYDIDGKELSVYAKVNATFFKKINAIYNRLLVGVDFKSDGNLGKGKQFSSQYPPYRVLSAVNASFRERDYRDIPFMNQYSAYAEDNMNYTKKKFKARLQAGVRYDAYSEVGSIVTPRLNLAIDPLPDVLTLRGAYGVQAKAPTLLYVYPEKAYFEYVNINEMSSTTVPDNQKLFITTTRIFDTQNKDLKVATNKSFEVGLDLRIKNMFLELTGFSDKLANGYMLDNTVNTFKPLIYNEYKRTTEGIVLSQSNPVLAKFSTPTNHLVNNTKGLEFNLNLGRIDAIRTSISANGAWINSEVYNNDYYYYDDASGTGGKDRTHIGLYEKGMEKRYDENLITALRLTHNIPEIGFVVTLTMQTTWMDKNWYKYGNDSLPVKYISKLDGNVYDFDPAKKNDAEFKKLRRTPSTKNYIEESLPPLFCFNMNITKEIGDFMRVSFFANNLFRDYPIAESKRSPGTYYVRNGQFFFGLELSLYLKQFKL